MKKIYSIAITVYNDEKEIGHLLDNLLAQTVKPAEIVIADGGSKDKTFEIIKKYINNIYDIPIRFIQGKRLNIAEGLNEAIRNCKYGYVGIAMTGNLYENNFFELLYDFMIDGKFEIVYGCIKGAGDTKFSRLYNQALLNGNQGKDFGLASNHGVLISKEVFDKIGYFYEKFVYAGEDTEYYSLAQREKIAIGYNSNAVLYWSTPKTWREYLKQKKVYTIAEMQIESFRNILRKRAVALLILFVGITSFILAAICLKWYVLFVAVVGCVLFWIWFHMIKGYETQKIILYLLETYLPIYNMIRYCKYLKKNYKVKRMKSI